MECVSGESGGIYGRVGAARGVLLSPSHAGSAELNFKGRHTGKIRSHNTRLEGSTWKEVEERLHHLAWQEDEDRVCRALRQSCSTGAPYLQNGGSRGVGEAQAGNPEPASSSGSPSV